MAHHDFGLNIFIDCPIKLLGFIEIIEIDGFFTANLIKLLCLIEILEIDVFFYS